MKSRVSIILLLIHNPRTRELGKEDAHRTAQNTHEQFNICYLCRIYVPVCEKRSQKLASNIKLVVCISFPSKIILVLCLDFKNIPKFCNTSLQFFSGSVLTG